MRKGYMILVAATLGVLGLAIFFARGSFLVFFDAPSLMLTFIPTVLMLLASFSPSEFIQAFRIAGKNESADREALKNAMVFFETAQRLLLLMGVIGLMLGCMLMLSAGWEIQKFSLGLSYALVCMLYAFITIFLVIVPYRNALQKKLNSLE